MVGNTPQTISVDRLKPAHLPTDPGSGHTPIGVTNRSGRLVIPPARYSS
jgi:hypothetical protein